jgi:DNA-binding FadR family transcriptional regulator
MIVQMSKALGELLRTSFEISTKRKDGPRDSLPLHKALMDAVAAGNPARAERACLLLIDGASADIELVLASHKRLPRSATARRLSSAA